MALRFRCPNCYLQMKPAPELLYDRAHHRSGTRYAGMVAPADDTRAFPCRRCDAPVERGKLVRGEYDERFPLWVAPAAPLFAAGFGYLAGWLLGWGETAGIVVGALTLLFGWFGLSGLHHGLVENARLARLGRETAPFLLGSAIVLTAALAAALALGTWLHAKAGWLAAAGGVIALFLAILGLIGGIGHAKATKRKRVSYAEIAEENRRQAGPR